MRLQKTNIDLENWDAVEDLNVYNFDAFERLTEADKRRIRYGFGRSAKYDGDCPADYSDSEIVQMLSEDGLKIVI